MRGSKRRRSNGSWELRVYLGKDLATGREKQLSRTFHGTAREADEALRRLLDSNVEPAHDGIGATFDQLVHRWLEECERLELSPTTLRTYRSQLDRNIRPAFGNVRLIHLTPKHLDDLYGEMKRRGLSAKTIRNHHAIVSAVLHQATRWGWLNRNIAEQARPPRVPRSRVSAPSAAQVRSVVDAAEERDPRIAPLLLLAALTGMRRAELCALRWSDLDLERGVVEVQRSLVVVPGGVVEKSTKTGRDRTVALDAVAVALLEQHWARTTRWAEQVDGVVASDAFVFSPYQDGSNPFRPDNVTSFFIRVRNSLGLSGVRLHDLRHFTATQLIGAGIDVRTVAGRLGHADPSLTLRVYSHVIEERDRVAASILGEMLGGVASNRLQ